jgi:lipopolysaccharide biosynthesis regulator YciM
MDPLWLLLLLPIASLSGYAFGRRSSERSSGQRVDRLSRNYFRGLNLLLNEQTEKALEIFVEIAQVDSDTFEVQLALGSLFRRRGEVDKAIRLHENLYARPLLSVEQRLQALEELGEDFMRAGLLDRAESLYQQMLEVEPRSVAALNKLIEIFEQENEWQQAIGMAQRLSAAAAGPTHVRIAHYHCELAERALLVQDQTVMQEQLQAARAVDQRGPRTELIAAQAALAADDSVAAVNALARAAEMDPDFIPELLPYLQRALDRPDSADAARKVLQRWVELDRGVSAALAEGELLRRTTGAAAEREFLTARLRVRPSVRVLKRMLEMDLPDQELCASPTLSLSVQVIRGYLERKPTYRCVHCGFSGRTLHWQCPSCKTWGSTKPVHGAAGE